MYDHCSRNTVGNERKSLSSGNLVAWRILSAIRKYIVSENKGRGKAKDDKHYNSGIQKTQGESLQRVDI